tara:strand:- start:422 stop:664 length:243 start_codon:yes stop_codon:yes gene_type:complete
MATATFHSNKGEKSALILVKKNPFVFETTPVYVPRQACADYNEGDTFEIPDGYTLVDMVGEDGVAYTTKDGSAILKMLSY